MKRALEEMNQQTAQHVQATTQEREAFATQKSDLEKHVELLEKQVSHENFIMMQAAKDVEQLQTTCSQAQADLQRTTSCVTLTSEEQKETIKTWLSEEVQKIAPLDPEAHMRELLQAPVQELLTIMQCEDLLKSRLQEIIAKLPIVDITGHDSPGTAVEAAEDMELQIVRKRLSFSAAQLLIIANWRISFSLILTLKVIFVFV